MVKKLAISFVWHMHQPSYKDEESGLYLMPWVRLHSIKDYLDMLLLLDEFPNIKQTFNLVPLLLDQIEDYAYNDAHDIHSKYTISDVEQFSEEDRDFILTNFFAANYAHQIAPNPRYLELYNKYFNEEHSNADFSKQELSDIMALFNLVWFDPLHIEQNDELKALIKKQENYTLQDRIRIIDIQRDIMKRIIPEYKKHLEQGKIEISTSPYYHPNLPLLINHEIAKSINHNITLPDTNYSLKDDVKLQVEKSIKKIEQTFGIKPQGMWLPELCISNDTLKTLLNYDLKWTIVDESILSKTLKKDFVRNYRGILEDPFDLATSQCFISNNKEINLIFRDATLSNLISFEYANYDPIIAANDLYERLKIAQDKLDVSPIEEHVLVLAIDGENCWENYAKDGIEFLRALYTLINNDETLEAVTVSEYLSKVKIKQILKTIQAGSWINADFEMWIGDPTKNFAWDYLCKAQQDYISAIQDTNYSDEIKLKAQQELLVAEGSDWFWWYGSPNNSGKDEVFDYLYRSHLRQMYETLDLNIPEYLNIPLENFLGKPSKHPRGLITPILNGKITSDEWANAGCIEIPQSPTIANRMLDRICFGNDKNNIYIMFDFNKYYMEKTKDATYPNELFVYFARKDSQHYSSIRLRNKNENIPQILKYVYTHEIQIPTTKERIMPIIFSKSIENSMWKTQLAHNINYFFDDVLELQIPFEDLNMAEGDGIYMVFIMCKSSIITQVLPLDNAIYIERP